MAYINFNNVTLKYPNYSAGSKSLRNNLVKIGTGGRVSKDVDNIVSITASQKKSLSNSSLPQILT